MPIFEQGFFDRKRVVVVRDKRTGRKLFEEKDYLTGGGATEILVLKRLFELKKPSSVDEVADALIDWFRSGVLKPEYFHFDAGWAARGSLLGTLAALYIDVLELRGIDYIRALRAKGVVPGKLEASLSALLPDLEALLTEHLGTIDPFEHLEVEVVSEE